MKVTFTTNIKDFQNLERFREYVRKEVVDEGLDQILDDSLAGLKNYFLDIINNEIRINGKVKSADGTSESNIDIPQSEAELLKFITAKNGKPGVDLNSFIKNKGKDYSTFLESKVVTVPPHRTSLRIPMAPFETFDEQLAKAKKFFGESIFVFTDSKGMPAYYLNPGINIDRFVKIVCSTDTGDTAKSRKKYEHYQTSNKMTRQQNSEIGRFSEWSVKKEGTDFIKNNFINISQVMNLLKEQKYSEAESLLNMGNVSADVAHVLSKIKDLKEGNNLTPGVQVYTELLSLVNTMAIEKKRNEKQNMYVLTAKSSYEQTSGSETTLGSIASTNKDEGTEKYNAFYDNLQRQLSMWKITNEDHWFKALVDKTEKSLKKFEG
jgi:hypothetical protein